MSQTFASENLKELRKRAGWSRQKLSEKLAQNNTPIAPPVIRRIEDEGQQMKVPELVAMSDVFGVDVQQFIFHPINREASWLMEMDSRLQFAVDALRTTAQNYGFVYDDLPRKLEQVSDEGKGSPVFNRIHKTLESLHSLEAPVSEIAHHFLGPVEQTNSDED